MSRRVEVSLIVAPIATLLLFAAREGLRHGWYRGYSKGTRTGIICEIFEDGRLFRQYFPDELARRRTAFGRAAELRELSVDDDAENNPVVKQFHGAEQSGTHITLEHRRDPCSTSCCTPSERCVPTLEKQGAALQVWSTREVPETRWRS